MTMIEDCGKESDLTYCRTVVFSFISITLLILLVYSNSFDCSWHFDDTPNIVENPRLHMKEISWESIKSAIFSDRNNPHFPYRPVACLSFALNYYFGKLNVFGYHVVNLLIHLVASIFLFLFIYRTLLYLSSKRRWAGDPYFVALLATVLWAINPIQTQAVTYIVQRMASMAALFYLVSMYYYLEGRTSQEPRKKTLHFGLCGLFFVLGLATKENAAMLPLSLFLYEVLILQRDPKKFLKSNWVTIVVIICFTAFVGVGYFLLKNGGFPDFSSWYKNRPFTLGQRLLTEPRVLFFYLSLLFYPMPYRLSLTHDFSISTSLFDPPTTALAVAAVLALAIGGILLARRCSLISFSILFFLLNHVIESSIFPLELVFEHRNYLPSLFIFLPVALGFGTLLKYYTRRPFMRFVLSGFIVSVIVGLGHSSFMRNFVWRNELSLWLDAVDKAPNSYRAHHNLAKYYQDTGKLDKAVREYQIALAKPVGNQKNEKFISFYNLGRLYEKKGDVDKAIKYYKKSISLEPRFPNSYNNLGILLQKRSRYLQAREYLEHAYTLDPSNATFNFNLGLHYLLSGKPKRAIPYFIRSSRSPKLEAASLANLGIANKMIGRLAKASIYLIRSLEKKPRDSVTRLNLAEILFAQGLENRAIKEARMAVAGLKNPRALRALVKRLLDKDKRSIMPDPGILIYLLKAVYKNKGRALHSSLLYLEKLEVRYKKFEGSDQQFLEQSPPKSEHYS